MGLIIRRISMLANTRCADMSLWKGDSRWEEAPVPPGIRNIWQDARIDLQVLTRRSPTIVFTVFFKLPGQVLIFHYKWICWWLLWFISSSNITTNPISWISLLSSNQRSIFSHLGNWSHTGKHHTLSKNIYEIRTFIHNISILVHK